MSFLQEHSRSVGIGEFKKCPVCKKYDWFGGSSLHRCPPSFVVWLSCETIEENGGTVFAEDDRSSEDIHPVNSREVPLILIRNKCQHGLMKERSRDRLGLPRLIPATGDRARGPHSRCLLRALCRRIS